MGEPDKEIELLPEGTKATAFFLTRGDSVLLGLKKRGIFKDKLLGPGGKLREGESSGDCVKREAEEEIGVKLKNMRKVGSINFFYIEDEKSTSQQVDFYLVDDWEGKPQETEEIKPVWYKRDEIPVDQMPGQNKLFIQQILKGQFVSGNLVLDKDMNLVSNQLVFQPPNEQGA